MTAKAYCVYPFSEFQVQFQQQKNEYKRRAIPVTFFSYSSLRCVEVRHDYCKDFYLLHICLPPIPSTRMGENAVAPAW